MPIDNQLNQIMTAVYGKDVRQAIHDAIQQCYTDAGNQQAAIREAAEAATATLETVDEKAGQLNDRLDVLYYPIQWTPGLSGGPNSGGIKYTWAGNQCHVNGTKTNSSTPSFHIFENSPSVLQHGFKAGRTYMVRRTEGIYVNLQIFPYINGSLDTNKLLFDSPSSGIFTIPANASGLYMRLNVSTLNAVDETFTLYFASARDWHIDPVDTNTEDESDKLDMTDAIQANLNDFGYCHLGTGIYYVRGGIEMPVGSTLEGEGKGTIVRLLASANTHIIRAARNNTIRDIQFSGAYTMPTTPSSDITGRRGVRIGIDGDSNGWTESCVVSGCLFRGFSGSGIFMANSGGGIETGHQIINCKAEYCGVGLNIDSLSEYNKITNLITFRCYYACVNHGGNNTFVGCSFHGVKGFLLDNSSVAHVNSGHGSAVGCTFNHLNNWASGTLGNGDAIYMRSGGNGFVFSGCQFWYGKVDIQNTPGIVFNGCEFGGNSNLPPTITVTGYPVVLNGCIFMTTPTLTLPNGSTVTSCRDANGTDVSPYNEISMDRLLNEIQVLKNSAKTSITQVANAYSDTVSTDPNITGRTVQSVDEPSRGRWAFDVDVLDDLNISG